MERYSIKLVKGSKKIIARLFLNGHVVSVNSGSTVKEIIEDEKYIANMSNNMFAIKTHGVFAKLLTKYGGV